MGFDKQELCMGCMQPLAWDGRCTCGFDRESYPSDSHYLPLGSLLKNGEYMVGKVLGEGGFGITYIGFDQSLLSRIAIKEYYPSGFAGRDVSNGNYNVCPYGGDAGEFYKKGLEAFCEEGRILARFSDMEGIVKVRSLFQENQTAYIIMEYVEGDSVKDYVLECGRISPQKVWEMMEQPIRALQAVHERQLVHRDVSADNLMIGRNGKITLIDFGSARSSNVMDEKTRTTICKQGFSALEQYSKEGKQGPWTDVYSICATMYYMLTGIVPKNSTERIVDDMVVPLGRMDDIDLEPKKKDALMTGMAVKSSERFQNMEALYFALYGEGLRKPVEPAFDFRKGEKDIPAEKRRLKKNERDEKHSITRLIIEALKNIEEQKERDRIKKFLGKIAGGIFAVLVLALVFWGMRGYIRIGAGVGSLPDNSAKPVSEADSALRVSEGVQTGSILPDEQRVGNELQASSMPLMNDTDKLQGNSSPQAGSTPQGSSSPQTSSTPQGSNSPQTSSTPQGSNSPQTSSIPQGSDSPQGTASQTVKMPEVAGLKKAVAVERIKRKGLRCKVLSRNHNSVSAGTVIRASIAAGKAIEKGKKITLYVSKGKKVTATPKQTIAPRQTPIPTPQPTRRPVVTRKPVATKKPSKKDDNLAGDLDSILY